MPPTGISGTLAGNPNDGRIGCVLNRNDPTIISVDALDSAAFVRFEVPEVQQWSIGFLYHIGSGATSATYIWSRNANEIYAQHWARRNGEYIPDAPSERVQGSILRTGKGQWNELAFRTSLDGSFLRLNDETVIEVPESHLIRHRGLSQLCAEFNTTEDEPYSIRYSDLRTRFTRDGVSGKLTHNDIESGQIVCPSRLSDNAYFANYADESWVLLDVVAPDVKAWSMGFLYNIDGSNHSQMMLSWNRQVLRVEHVNYDGEEIGDSRYETIPDVLIETNPIGKLRLEFETSWRGSSLRLNGAKVMHVPPAQVPQRLGGIGICIGLYGGETEPYTIRFSDLWAWSE